MKGAMEMAAQVSTRGQITIDRGARRALAVEPGMVAVQYVVDGHLEVYFVPAPHRRSLFGALAKPTRRTAGDVADWAALERRAAQSIAEEAG
jgi:bifunctional DNA-binding transcriptional regulator/antitoxin component of YhaV-PrlF toxin-antitoxin module